MLQFFKCINSPHIFSSKGGFFLILFAGSDYQGDYSGKEWRTAGYSCDYRSRE